MLKAMREAPWETPSFYKNWLAQSYYYVAYSTRLLAAAAGAASVEQQEYYRRCVQHIKEESGHDKMAVADLKHLGGDLKDFPELGVTRSMWESQYYKISKEPTALLGYILALEILAVETLPQIHKMLNPRYSEKACLFVRVHAEDDPEHVEEALKQIETLPVELRAAVLTNFHQTCEMYTLMLKQIQATSSLHS